MSVFVTRPVRPGGIAVAYLYRHRLILCLAVLTAAGLALRLYGLDLRGITHPEIYVPGIDLPAGISEPPPRHLFLETLAFHFHLEPHPLGWYVAMLGWTDMFGTSEWWMRLPSVIFGAAAIPVMYRLGATAYDRSAGIAAAALLVAHGSHVFWSQAARMYVPGYFFAALSMYFLLRAAYSARREPGAEAGYVLAVFAGIETTDLFWPFLLLQVGWALMVLPATAGFAWRDAVALRFAGAHRLIQIQSLTLMISAPELLHSVYLARNQAAETPSFTFVRDYLTLGFAATRADNILAEGTLWLTVRLVALALCVVLMIAGLGARTSDRRAVASGPDLPRWLPFAVALAMTAFMAWLVAIATHRNAPLALVATGPALSLLLPAFSRFFTDVLARLRPGQMARWSAKGPKVLLVMIGFVGPAVLFMISFKMTLLAPRAFLVFVPALLVLVAAGAVALARGRLSDMALAALLVVLTAASVPYPMTDPGSPRDYKGLAAAINAKRQPGDLVMVRRRNWEDTPIFYYLRDANLVANDYEAALAAHPGARVWVVLWPGGQGSGGMDAPRAAALENYHRTDAVSALRARAELYEANP